MTKRYVGLFLVCALGCADSVTDIPQVVAESPQVETAEAINTQSPSVEKVVPYTATLQASANDSEFAEPIQGGFEPPVSVGLLPEVIPPHRDRKRMDIDQLSAAILAATNGVGWTVNGDDQFEELARTLGKPDYFDLTSEDLEPAALFQKFLDDAARHVCYELADTEVELATEQRVLMVHASPEDTLASAPEKIEQNLAYLLKRYHGRHVALDGAGMQSFRWLYESAEHVTQDPVLAWRTVCVGLIVHPEFYTY